MLFMGKITMIELNQVKKSYQTPEGSFLALRDISLKVQKGEIFGVIGRSGAGKSTLIRTVNLLERPDSGTVKVNDVNLTSLPENDLIYQRRHIGMIFQQFNLLSTRTVFDNVALPLEIEKRSKKEIKERVSKLLEFTGLGSKQKAYPHELSGGQKQRVAIARALANEPKVLLSDEATSSLDPETTDTILDLLRQARDSFGLTILLITHEMDVIRKICDRTCILDQGQIVEEGPTLQLFAHPQSEIGKSFVYSNFHVNLPEGLKASLVSQPDDHAVPVVRFTFSGSKTEEPVLLELYKKFKVTSNILQANFNWVHDANVGMCVCELIGQREAIVQGIQFVQSQNVDVEVLGYVHQ